MLNDYERERLLVLQRRLEILRASVTNAAKIAHVVEWVVSDWQAEINSLLTEDRL